MMYNEIKREGWKFVVLIIAVYFFGIFTHWAHAKEEVTLQIPAQIEYKVVVFKPNEIINLNQLGMDGWDLCAAFATDAGGTRMIFKRVVRVEDRRMLPRPDAIVR